MELRGFWYSGESEERLLAMNNTSLQGICWRDGLATGGTKAALVRRLQDHLKGKYGTTDGDDAVSRFLREFQGRGGSGSGSTSTGSAAAAAAPADEDNRIRPDISLQYNMSELMNDLKKKKHNEKEEAYRVLEMEGGNGNWKPDSPHSGCQARATAPAPVSDAAGRGEQLRAATQRHILGKHTDESWLLSLSLKLEWAIFFAIKSIRERGKKAALIITIDLSKLGEQTIVNCSSQETATAVGITSWSARAWCSSAREVLVEKVPPESIKGDGLLCIDSSSTHGQSLLSIEGKDRETDLSTNEITRYGCFSEWLKAFDAKYPDPKDREWLFTKLYVPMPSNSVSRSDRARKAPTRNDLL